MLGSASFFFEHYFSGPVGGFYRDIFFETCASNKTLSMFAPLEEYCVLPLILARFPSKYQCMMVSHLVQTDFSLLSSLPLTRDDLQNFAEFLNIIAPAAQGQTQQLLRLFCPIFLARPSASQRWLAFNQLIPAKANLIPLARVEPCDGTLTFGQVIPESSVRVVASPIRPSFS